MIKKTYGCYPADILMISLKQKKKINYQTDKPKCVADYNALMGAVDKIDMISSSLRCVRKSTKWYKKYFFHLLDIAIYNAYILHKSANNKTGTFENFHLPLIKDILQKYLPRRVEAEGRRFIRTIFHFC